MTMCVKLIIAPTSLFHTTHRCKSPTFWTEKFRFSFYVSRFYNFQTPYAELWQCIEYFNSKFIATAHDAWCSSGRLVSIFAPRASWTSLNLTKHIYFILTCMPWHYALYLTIPCPMLHPVVIQDELGWCGYSSVVVCLGRFVDDGSKNGIDWSGKDASRLFQTGEVGVFTSVAQAQR